MGTTKRVPFDVPRYRACRHLARRESAGFLLMTPQPRSSAMRDRVGWKAGTVFLVGITLLATASTRAADDRAYYMALRRPPGHRRRGVRGRLADPEPTAGLERP